MLFSNHHRVTTVKRTKGPRSGYRLGRSCIGDSIRVACTVERLLVRALRCTCNLETGILPLGQSTRAGTFMHETKREVSTGGIGSDGGCIVMGWLHDRSQERRLRTCWRRTGPTIPGTAGGLNHLANGHASGMAHRLEYGISRPAASRLECYPTFNCSRSAGGFAAGRALVIGAGKNAPTIRPPCFGFDPFGGAGGLERL
jgi:hypothetical protein